MRSRANASRTLRRRFRIRTVPTARIWAFRFAGPTLPQGTGVGLHYRKIHGTEPAVHIAFGYVCRERLRHGRAQHAVMIPMHRRRTDAPHCRRDTVCPAPLAATSAGRPWRFAAGQPSAPMDPSPRSDGGHARMHRRRSGPRPQGGTPDISPLPHASPGDGFLWASSTCATVHGGIDVGR